MTEFGPRMREVREQQRLSREALADRIGQCEAKTVWLWETGKMRPTMRSVVRIAEGLGVPPTDLLP